MKDDALPAEPRWSRRKDARPAEIVDAAIDVFVEHGFAGAKLDEIAQRAGIAKGTLYRYFDSKEDIFRAVARQAIEGNLQGLEASAASADVALQDFVPLLLTRAAARMGDGRIPAILRMVIAESKSFPDLARVWHDDVAARMLDLVTRRIEDAQARGQVRPGDARLHAFSIVGPMIAALLFREILGPFSADVPDLPALAAQHADTVLSGLLVTTNPPRSKG